MLRLSRLTVCKDCGADRIPFHTKEDGLIAITNPDRPPSPKIKNY